MTITTLLIYQNMAAEYLLRTLTNYTVRCMIGLFAVNAIKQFIK